MPSASSDMWPSTSDKGPSRRHFKTFWRMRCCSSFGSSGGRVEGEEEEGEE